MFTYRRNDSTKYPYPIKRSPWTARVVWLWLAAGAAAVYAAVLPIPGC